VDLSYLIYTTELRRRNPSVMWRTFPFRLVAKLMAAVCLNSVTSAIIHTANASCYSVLKFYLRWSVLVFVNNVAIDPFSISTKLCYANSVNLTEKINALEITSPPLSVSCYCTTHLALHDPYRIRDSQWFLMTGFITTDRFVLKFFCLFLQDLHNKFILACVSLHRVA
jgi:hypothetical protein